MRSNGLGGLVLSVLGIVLAAILLVGFGSRALAQTGPGGMMGPGAQTPQGTPVPGQPWWGPGGMMGPGAWGGPNGLAGPNWGQGLMGGMAGMMGGPYAPDVKPISSTDAANLADRYLQSIGNSDLTFDEIHSFTYNFYVPVYEKSTGNFAFELLVDRFGGGVVPEMGPNMMWNAKYGMMAGSMMGPWGMMGGWWGGQGQQGNQQAATVDTSVNQDTAVKNAQQFLDSFIPGAKTGEVHSFYGYRTVDVERDGQMVGMLSINGYSGAVWYHTWHGDFLENWKR